MRLTMQQQMGDSVAGGQRWRKRYKKRTADVVNLRDGWLNFQTLVVFLLRLSILLELRMLCLMRALKGHHSNSGRDHPAGET
jgi:hypothetical protein